MDNLYTEIKRVFDNTKHDNETKVLNRIEYDVYVYVKDRIREDASTNIAINILSAIYDTINKKKK